jgi:hypothetical protein
MQCTPQHTATCDAKRHTNLSTPYKHGPYNPCSKDLPAMQMLPLLLLARQNAKLYTPGDAVLYAPKLYACDVEAMGFQTRTHDPAQRRYSATSNAQRQACTPVNSQTLFDPGASTTAADAKHASRLTDYMHVTSVCTHCMMLNCCLSQALTVYYCTQVVARYSQVAIQLCKMHQAAQHIAASALQPNHRTAPRLGGSESSSAVDTISPDSGSANLRTHL